jgi:hypothetical protein
MACLEPGAMPPAITGISPGDISGFFKQFLKVDARQGNAKIKEQGCNMRRAESPFMAQPLRFLSLAHTPHLHRLQNYYIRSDANLL